MIIVDGKIVISKDKLLKIFKESNKGIEYKVVGKRPNGKVEQVDIDTMIDYIVRMIDGHQDQVLDCIEEEIDLENLPF